ncbi:uncharacterized protein LOC121382055 isoform X2 [Gigantopelta aegis]|uniref:uncharacterized protein LOC121382055 isoform X2 n=1 Tax=Gigantopelta aegis TaxID=1735272 RepID=UPI001B88C6EC|nr:uncharacterized protein LOC121382055 isoform X2 [Gigantopelta aegis]
MSLYRSRRRRSSSSSSFKMSSSSSSFKMPSGQKKDQLSGTKKDGRSIGRLETMETKTNWESFINACDEFSTDSKKVIKYIKRKIKGRKGEKQTEVKTIHIVPDDDEAKWARRSANSAASRTSTDTAYSSCSTESRDNDGIEVVHDMAVDTPDTC